MYYKGIIIDIHDKYIIVMNESGGLLKIRRKENVNIGQAILFTDDDIIVDKKVNKIIKIWTVPIVTAALIFISIVSGIINVNNKNTPYALLTFDINPSFSIEVNKDNTVINAVALNDDAKSLDIDKIKNKSLNDALKLIKTSLKENKKFEDKNSLIVGFSFLGENKNVEFEDNVKAVINENFNDFKIVYIQGDKGDHEEAKKVGISLGKYSINKRLNNRFSEEQMKNIAIDELIDIFNEENINLKDNEEDYDDVNDEKDHDNKIDSDNEIEQDYEVDDDDKTEDKENDKDDHDNKEKEQDKNSKSVNSDLNDDDTYEDDKYENDNDEDENDEDHNKQEISDDKDSSDNLNDSDDD
ncbi:anti-sigma factor domain-containing protein [Clostridium perfringens]|uniref:anti-sigma factor domain-containing protein n=1 Tax=Clostridium perfringens TaxID=1502 RepID=UPI0028E1089A|nr:anti-sigma factor domain-containing protein [Clostridium perfringens]MDT9336848.1 anti-sigma factor domain-containing protein [Clostridium perfringens]MDT9344604.1 anti-sigma factor domain-containing protein [Clostridium perfringens]MDT9347847.1 anti-sigma factor domain-containing protein [Clostridium perfringens]MDT9353689.1 anti-sigma factor domain-containing protein [Clostridium perfringens]